MYKIVQYSDESCWNFEMAALIFPFTLLNEPHLTNRSCTSQSEPNYYNFIPKLNFSKNEFQVSSICQKLKRFRPPFVLIQWNLVSAISDTRVSCE